MILRILGHNFQYEMENLCRVFYLGETIKTVFEENIDYDEKTIITKLIRNDLETEIIVQIIFGSRQISNSQTVKSDIRNQPGEYERLMAIALFNSLSTLTGYVPCWGILTGVRPSKLMTNLIKQNGIQYAEEYFIKNLLVSGTKTKLAMEVALEEEKITKRSMPNSFSLYVSIPFCPSRCTYCSFVSHSITGKNAVRLLPEYVKNLCREIELTGEIASDLGLRLQTVYFGGGTPTSMNEDDLNQICGEIKKSFNLDGLLEYTVEAGRPDTITPEKLSVMIQNGINRISINPQSFNDTVLESVGRNHTARCALDAYKLAQTAGFKIINMDIIAGLPGDTAESFSRTLDIAINLLPENITVHTLALKRSSYLAAQGNTVFEGKTAAEMIETAYLKLKGNQYKPYYMYRQSRSLGNLENTGWCRTGCEGIYNVFMMEECQTILAVGAGAVTKLKQPRGSYIERIFNFKYPYEYNSRFDEIISKKKRVCEFFALYK